MDKKTALQKKLEEQFQALLPNKDAPAEIKEEVFHTLDLLDVVGDITDLFTTKFGKTGVQIVDLLDTDSIEKEK